MKDKYTANELAKILNITRRAISKRAKKERWSYTEQTVRGGKQKLFPYSSLPKDVQIAIKRNEAKELLTDISTYPAPVVNPIECLDEKRRRIALAKADLVHLYTQHIYKEKWGNKTQAREEFIQAYLGGAWPELLEVLGPVSWKSIERWKVEFERTQDYGRLADRRGLHKKGLFKLTDEQAKVILKCALNPNAPKISQIYRRAKAVLKARGIAADFSEATARRFLEKFKSTNYHVWVWMREGSKAWNDKCAYYIERDFSLLNVGDILVADGHKLNFETINPFTGKPCRMVLVLWFDMASNFPLGWEIWPTENIATIASSLRRAILRLGKFPRLVYLDNGKAFRAKVFSGAKDLSQSGFAGIFQKMGIQAIYAWPYHGQSKTVERFFSTFQELEVWMPSYVGTSIDSKPPRLNRGEKLHRKVYEKAGFRPLTLEETHMAVAMWFDEYARRPQRGHLKGKTPLEVFEKGRGPGVDPVSLRELMMAQEVRTINRNGISFLGQNYYSPALYGRKHRVYVRYDLQDRSSILVYDENWQFLCEAKRVLKAHPAANYLGEEEDRKQLQLHIEHKREQEKLASVVARKFLETEVIPEHKKIMAGMGIEDKKTALPETKEVKEEPKLTDEQVKKIIERAKKELETALPYKKPQFRDELDRYEFLFQVKYRDGIELLEEDREWMEKYEASDEYRQIKGRYEMLKEVYEQTLVSKEA